MERRWTQWCGEFGITAEDFARVGPHGRPAVEIATDLLPAEVVPGALARIEQLEVDDVPHGGSALPPGTAECLASLPVIAVVGGLPLGVLLVLTDRGGLLQTSSRTRSSGRS